MSLGLRGGLQHCQCCMLREVRRKICVRISDHVENHGCLVYAEILLNGEDTYFGILLCVNLFLNCW